LNQIDIVVIGTSAGGVEALKRLMPTIGVDFGPPIVIVQHFPENSKSVLPSILSRVTALPVRHAEDQEPLCPGTVYVAVPGKHLLVRSGHISLVLGPKQNGSRPAIDPLFRSAALCYGSRVGAVLLSGLLADGTVGMATVKRLGGTAIVQDPEDADYGDMPRNALSNVAVDYVVPLNEMGALLARLANTAPDLRACNVEEIMFDLMEMGPEQLRLLELHGKVSALTCPECKGALYEIEEGGVPHYNCRVGHSFSSENLLSAQSAYLESAIWAALRALQENNQLVEKLLDQAKEAGREKSTDYFRQKKTYNDQQIRLLRNALGANIESAEHR